MSTDRFLFGDNPGTALWDWDTSNPTGPIVRTFFDGLPTKTGLLPNDLQMAVGVPLQYYAGNTLTALPPSSLIGMIREAEDWVEQETNLLLTPTWIASPPEIQRYAVTVTNVPAMDDIGQRLGYDYDLADAAYDFYFDSTQDNSWMAQMLRYRPLRNVTTSALDFSAVKTLGSVYPVLSQAFRSPPTWMIEDQDFGMIRLVPTATSSMMPMFALGMAFMGRSQTIPGVWHYQYTAGLTPSDYSSRFRFMKRLVLLNAGIRALNSVQGTVNNGLMRVETLVDGLQNKFQYSESGPYGSIIKAFQGEHNDLLHTARDRVAGPFFITV